MSQTILMAAAAVHLIAMASLVTARTHFYIFVFQFYPVVLAFWLGSLAVARLMGWPIL